MNKKDLIKESINNLRDYINNDTFYNGETAVESDFDRFCYNHCKDIERILSVIPKRYLE